MGIINFLLFALFLIILIKCSDYAIRYSSRLAKALKFPEFVVSFFIIALISVLPEATISVISALNGEPSLGLGTLLGSNVADLTLVFGIVAFFSSGGIKIQSKILQNNMFYLILLVFPLVLGFDGKFSRIDGIILILAGSLFFVKTYMDKNKFRKKFNHSKKGPIFKNLIFLIISLGVIIFSAYYTVKYAVDFANDIKIPALLIGLTVLAFGTCLPELIFSVKAIKKNHDALALGDILGTVITDATIILGIVALICPFKHNPYDLYVTGTAMFIAGFLATIFMKSDKTLNKFEALLLSLFYILFLIIEFFVNNLLNVAN